VLAHAGVSRPPLHAGPCPRPNPLRHKLGKANLILLPTLRIQGWLTYAVFQ
jgi:hypothetical protein